MFTSFAVPFTNNIFAVMFLVRKIGIYTFSAYLLLLMLFPCTESHTLGGADSIAEYSGNADESSGTRHSDDDLCTPFCVCGHCVVAVVLQPVLEIAVPVSVKTSIQPSSFYSAPKSDFHGTIWQPPQLV